MHRYLFVLLSVLVLLALPGVTVAEPSALKWKYPLSNQIGPDAAVALGHDGTIYVPDGKSLLALDPSGNLKWVFTGSPDDQLGRPSVAKDGTVYVTQFANGYRPSGNGVYALDTSGKLLWTFDPPGFAIHSAMLGAISIAENGSIYVTGLQESDSTTHLYSVDIDGIQKWASPSDGGLSIPAIDSTGRLYSMGVYRLYGVSPVDGSTLVSASTEVGGHWRSPSLSANGTIYVVGSSRLHAYSSDGKMLWEYPHQGNFAEQPGEAVTGIDGTLYFTSFDYYQLTGRLHALTPDSSVNWVHEFPYREKPVGSPAIGNDGSIYVASEATAVPTSPIETGVIAFSSSGSLLWSKPEIQPRWSYYNSPIVGADGTLYILGYDSVDHNSTFVYAIDTSSTGPALSAWPMVGANAQHTNVVNGPPTQDRFSWPVDYPLGIQEYQEIPSAGRYRSCGEWPGDSEGCFWLNDTSTDQQAVWRDVQPFMKHYWRYKNISGRHLGADYNILSGDRDEGQFVYAVGKGVISKVESVPSWGNIIYIKHDTSFGTYISMYAHVDFLESGAPAENTPVELGTPIARVGKGSYQVCDRRGRCRIIRGTWPAHLHFEIRERENTDRGIGYTRCKNAYDTSAGCVMAVGPQGQIDPNAFIASHR